MRLGARLTARLLEGDQFPLNQRMRKEPLEEVRCGAGGCSCGFVVLVLEVLRDRRPLPDHASKAEGTLKEVVGEARLLKVGLPKLSMRE